jgi:hypothetical protein
VTRSTAIVGAAIIATAIGLAVFLRPKPTARGELAAPGTIPPAALAVLHAKMGRHDAQMKNLLDRVLMLDDDGIARAAGEIFDEPVLARPVLGDELNALLPERFFTLQRELRDHARQLVAASVRHDRAGVADEFGALSKSCVACHEVYLFESGAAAPHASR